MTMNSNTNKSGGGQSKMLYGRRDYMIMLIGLGVILLGLILMVGGKMPDEDTWDPNIIYSFRRITLAPILIIAGLCIEIYAIFRKDKSTQE